MKELTNMRDMLGKAIVLATLAHSGQVDKGGAPYILHPLTVMHKLKTTDVELQCIAVLHDVLEDCSGKFVTIGGETIEICCAGLERLGFSDRVIDGVLALTKIPGQSYIEYQEEIFLNKDAMLVKKEDLRTNSDLRRMKSRDVTDKDIQRVAKYMAFYAAIETKLEKL